MNDRTNNPDNPDEARSAEGPGAPKSGVTPGSLLPCPWWCDRISLHETGELDSTDWDNPAVGFRVHVHALGDWVAVVQDERHEAGNVQMLAPHISVHADRVEDVAEVQAFAAAINVAAALHAQVATRVS